MNIKNNYGGIIFTSAALTIKDALVEAVSKRVSLRCADLGDANLGGAHLRCADLSGADLRDANLRGADLGEKKVQSMRVFTGLYPYQIWAVLFQDGTCWVRMGCLFKSLEQWETEGGIRQSNLNEFPDDASDRCEERIAAFEFAKAAALRMKMPKEARPC